MEEELLKIISHYGLFHQLKHFNSEVYELNEAILNFETYEHLTEEIADCLVMIEQLRLYFEIPSEEVKKVFNKKIERQLKRMENGN